jgi:nitrogen fixation NifU-like protein
MFEDFRDFYNQMIVDHSNKPRNFHLLEGANHSAQGHNPICGDNIILYINLDGDLIKDISFTGSGCALSTASASMLTEFAKGKTKADVEKMFSRMRDLITTGNVTGDFGKLSVFSAVHQRPERVKCAILPWHAVMAALKGEDKPVTTESESN